MMKPLDKKILDYAYSLFPKSVKLRRELHQIPEVAWEEKKTSAHLKSFLGKAGISVRGVAKTGLIAEIRSGTGRCVALRTDLDALPITEETDYPFKSRHSGRMHACGHDMHMAIVTTAALILTKMTSDFRGTVKVLYQPAEESPPGGAERMIAEGALEMPNVGMIFGLHVAPQYRTGQIAVRDGAFFSGVLDFNIEILGKGGHGAYPHLTKDPIVCAAAVVNSLQAIVSRNLDAFEPAVITLGRIEGGTARNVIPSVCRLHCTARAAQKSTLMHLKRRIEAVTTNIARGYGCRARISYEASYPPLINKPEANSLIVNAARLLFGRRSVVSIDKPSLGGEDFARYLEKVPGAMFFLGVGNKRIGATYGWHHPKFKADEDAIPVGAAVLAHTAVESLNA